MIKLFAIRNKLANSLLVVRAGTHEEGYYDSNEELQFDRHAHIELTSWDRENDEADVIFASSKEVCEELMSNGKCDYPEIKINPRLNLSNLEIVSLCLNIKTPS